MRFRTDSPCGPHGADLRKRNRGVQPVPYTCPGLWGCASLCGDREASDLRRWPGWGYEEATDQQSVAKCTAGAALPRRPRDRRTELKLTRYGLLSSVVDTARRRLIAAASAAVGAAERAGPYMFDPISSVAPNPAVAGKPISTSGCVRSWAHRGTLGVCTLAVPGSRCPAHAFTPLATDAGVARIAHICGVARFHTGGGVVRPRE